MLQRSLITTACMLAFTALTASTATALVTQVSNNLTCSYSCNPAASNCTSGLWTQSNPGTDATGQPTATETCVSPAGASVCTVTITGGIPSGGQQGGTQVSLCFVNQLVATQQPCLAGLCGKKKQFCVQPSPGGGSGYCTSPVAPTGGGTNP
jgi:hypothetical protein